MRSQINVHSAPDPPRRASVVGLVGLTQMLHGAAEPGIAAELTAGERSCEDLAAACGAHPETLHRLLRGLASLGVFTETAPRTFALTPLAELLRSDHPESLRRNSGFLS